MLKGFRDFILRGNVVDLAVAVIIGAAFGAVVNQLTQSFLAPLIKAIFGGGQFGGAFRWRGQTFDYGAFINVVITFVLIAAILYFLVVLPLNKLNARRTRGRAPADEPVKDEVRLLTEIRDELRGQRQPL
jgi:large conductance mechanosensitive channel